MARELWPLSREYGGKVEFLLGVGTMEFSILFQYCGLTFISHNIDSNSPISFGSHYRSSKDENPSPSAALMQRVILENCPDDENPQLKPTDKIIQPNCYSAALSKFIPHSYPVKTSILLKDLGLDTPELFWSTYKMQTSGVNGNCFFASMVQQHPFLGETAAALRETFQQ